MLNIKSLREQLYEHFCKEMQSGRLASGASINISAISQELGISKTPLRDALIQLETEGFVTIQPRKGILVNKLTLQDIKDSYQIIGALEASVVRSNFDQFDTSHISKLEKLNADQLEAIQKNDFETYYRLNLDFHGVFLNMTDNSTLIRIITPLKQRLYDFPRRSYLKNWESQHLDEHKQFIECIKQGDKDGAASILKDVHWSFSVHEKYFKQFYELENGVGR